MIYELQSLTLTSRSIGEVALRLEQALPWRSAHATLVAGWRAEVGVLNTILLLWRYDSAEAMARAQEEDCNSGRWPPDIRACVVEQSSQRLTPAPFSPPMEPGVLGKLYEIRTYTYPADAIPGVIEAWQEIIEPRVKVSPLVLAAHTGTQPLCEWIHIWAYKDAAERERVRDAVMRDGIWPISVVDRRLKRAPRAVSLRMQNMLAVPLKFSPLR